MFNATFYALVPLFTVLIPAQIYLTRKWLAGKLLENPVWNFEPEEVNGATVPAPIIEKLALAFMTSYLGAYLCMYSVILTYGMINYPMELANEYKPLNLLDWTAYDQSYHNQRGLWYFVLGHQVMAMLGLFWQALFSVILDVRHNKRTEIKPLSKLRNSQRLTRMLSSFRLAGGERNAVNVNEAAANRNGNQNQRASLQEDYVTSVEQQIYGMDPEAQNAAMRAEN